MEIGEVRYLGDGAYVQFDGSGFRLMANSHLNPTDTVYLELDVWHNLKDAVEETLDRTADEGWRPS